MMIFKTIKTISVLLCLMLCAKTYAHHDVPTQTLAIKVPIEIQQAVLTGEVKESGFGSEGEKLEVEVTFQVQYTNHSDVVVAMEKLKMLSQYNVSYWNPLYKIETIEPQGRPRITDLPLSERLIAEHHECAEREAISVEARAWEMDLSFGEKVAVGVIGLVPGLVAAAETAPVWITASLFGVDVMGVVASASGGNDDLGFGSKNLPLNESVDLRLVGDDGGIVLTLAGIPVLDPPHDRCSIPEEEDESFGMLDPNSGELAIGGQYATLINHGGTAVNDGGATSRYSLPLTPRFKGALAPQWEYPSMASINESFDLLRDSFENATLVISEKEVSEERLAILTDDYKRLAISGARFATGQILSQVANKKDRKRADTFYDKANEYAVNSSDGSPGKSLYFYQAAYETAVQSLQEHAGKKAKKVPVEIIPLHDSPSVVQGDKLELMVSVQGDTSKKSELEITSESSFVFEARRRAGVGHQFLLRLNSESVKPGVHNVVFSVKGKKSKDTSSVLVEVLEPERPRVKKSYK